MDLPLSSLKRLRKQFMESPMLKNTSIYNTKAIKNRILKKLRKQRARGINCQQWNNDNCVATEQNPI